MGVRECAVHVLALAALLSATRCVEPSAPLRPAFTCEARTARAPGQQVFLGAMSVRGTRNPYGIQGLVRASYARFSICYAKGLRDNPTLHGRVGVRFVIAPDGTVSDVGADGSELPHAWVVACITRAFERIRFGESYGGIVVVQQPLLFCPPAPTADAGPAAQSADAGPAQTGGAGDASAQLVP